MISFALSPLVSFAQSSPSNVPANIGTAGVTIGKTGPMLPMFPKAINIPVITCPIVSMPGGTTVEVTHACLVNIPTGAFITDVIAYRRDGMEMNEGLETDISLYEMKAGNNNAVEVGDFTLKSTLPSAQVTINNAFKSDLNSFFVWIDDEDNRGPYPMDIPGQPPHPEPSQPYAYGRSGVQMISVRYK